ncbi:hypothetical protein M3Y98_00953900 [Aphelenchoides besseyi]|nr:hypothetical protein M3Y98_00953900 [Aphelenchoides besseyi]
MDQENNTSEAFENERHYLGDLLDDEGFISWKLDDCKSNSNFEISEQLSIESENINVTPESVHSDPGYAHSITRDSFCIYEVFIEVQFAEFLLFKSHLELSSCSFEESNSCSNTASAERNAEHCSWNKQSESNFSKCFATSKQSHASTNFFTSGQKESSAFASRFAFKRWSIHAARSEENDCCFCNVSVQTKTKFSTTTHLQRHNNIERTTENLGFKSVNEVEKKVNLNRLLCRKSSNFVDCVARDADVFKFAKKRNQQSSKPQKSSTSKQVAELKSNGPTKNGKHANVTENGATFGLRKFESKFDVLQKLTDLSTNEERIREVESTNRRSPSLSIRSDSSDGSAEVENGSSTRGSSKRSSRSNGQQSSGTSSPTTTQKTFAPSALATSLLGLYQKPKTKRQKVKRPCSDGIWVIIIALLMNAYTLFSKGLFWVFDLVVDFVYLLFVAAIMLFRKVVSKFT